MVEHILIGVELFSCYRVLASIFFEVLQYEVFFVSQPALVEVGLIKQLLEIKPGRGAFIDRWIGLSRCQAEIVQASLATERRCLLAARW